MTAASVEATHAPVLVVDFGAQYAQLIARRVREAKVYSEIVPHTASVEAIAARQPAAVVLSGGPQSVYAEGAPQVDPRLFELGIPVFGICYGFQAMAAALGGEVARTGLSEFGRTPTTVVERGTLLDNLPDSFSSWMSHGDAVKRAPDGFSVLAHTAGAPVAAFEDPERRLAGVQWHPEVLHSQHGQQVLAQFLYDVAGLEPNWTAANIVEESIAAIREQVGDWQVLCALSGGVDSAVAAALVHKAIGDQLTCAFVDHGLLRKGEREQVKEDFVRITGINLVVADAEDQFLGALAWATLVLSLGAVLIMMRLLASHSAARVSSLFFLTPALSALEGAVLFGERLGPLAIVGLVVAAAGVWLTMRDKPSVPVDAAA